MLERLANFEFLQYAVMYCGLNRIMKGKNVTFEVVSTRDNEKNNMSNAVLCSEEPTLLVLSQNIAKNSCEIQPNIKRPIIMETIGNRQPQHCWRIPKTRGPMHANCTTTDIYEGKFHPSGSWLTRIGNSNHAPFTLNHEDAPNAITNENTSGETSLQHPFCPIFRLGILLLFRRSFSQRNTEEYLHRQRFIRRWHRVCQVLASRRFRMIKII